ncbi:hypothetical protein JTB14_017984 [Gonioctena quinquepunctata]|nr:hypothetical protein JTB14_017984 [Gonioctena quinquepunctata]
MQLCWTNAESRPSLTQINLMLSDLLQVHRNTKSNASPSTLSVDDFDERWDSFKPNSIVKTDHVSDTVSIEMHFPESNVRKSLSASLNNLHGSLEDLLDVNGDSHVLFIEDELRNTGFSSANDESITSEPIFTSDSSDHESTVDMKPKVKSKGGSDVKTKNSVLESKLFQKTSSESETEDEHWRNKVERGAYTEKVRLKSKSVADLMVLTHVDYSESESETPLPSLDYKVNYKNVRSLENGNKTYGSEGNLLSIQGTFQEELRKLQEDRKDSLLFVPDSLSRSESGNVMDDVSNPSRLIQELNSPAEIKPAGQVFNVFNVTIDKYNPLEVNKLSEIINYDERVATEIIKIPEGIGDESVKISMNNSDLNCQVDCVRNGSNSSQDSCESDSSEQKLTNECYPNQTNLNIEDSLEKINTDALLPASFSEQPHPWKNVDEVLGNSEYTEKSELSNDTGSEVIGACNENVGYKLREVEEKDNTKLFLGNIVENFVEACNENVNYRLKDEALSTLDGVKNYTVNQKKIMENLVETCNENVGHKLKEAEEIDEMENGDGHIVEASNENVNFNPLKPLIDIKNNCEIVESPPEICNENVSYKLKENEQILDKIEKGDESKQFVSNDGHTEKPDCSQDTVDQKKTIEHFVEALNTNVGYKLKEVEEIAEMEIGDGNIVETSNKNVNFKPLLRNVDYTEKRDIVNYGEKECETAESPVDTCNDYVSCESMDETAKENFKQSTNNVGNHSNDTENMEVFNENVNNELKEMYSSSKTKEPCGKAENHVETCNENVDNKLKEVEITYILDSSESSESGGLKQVKDVEVKTGVNENSKIESISPVSLPDILEKTYTKPELCETFSLTTDSERNCDKMDEVPEGRRVNFDLSNDQDEAMPNSLTHANVFASTPFRKREISLPLEDKFSSINLFASPEENEKLDADFSMEFSQLEKVPENKGLNYSLETWDIFLGTTLDHQNGLSDNLFDSFSSEPKSILFVDNEDVSNKEADLSNKLLNQTLVLNKNGGDDETGEEGETNSTFVVDKTEKTFTVEEKPTTSDDANSTYVKEASGSGDQDGGSWENGGGWFLHPQTTNNDLRGEMQIQSPQTESYVGFGIDDEIMSAIRNELLTKLPHAQGGAAEKMKDDDEWDSGERNEVFLKYNVYNTPLSPIPEESYVEEHSQIESIRHEGENEDSDWSERCETETLAQDTENQSTYTLDTFGKGPHHRHTPSQDSCCSNDTLFNLEELNNGTLEAEKDIDGTFIRKNLDVGVTEGETNNNVGENPDKTIIIEPAESNTSPEFNPHISSINSTTPDLINSFLLEERHDATMHLPDKSNLTLEVNRPGFKVKQHVPLPSPEDNPWKQLPASLLSFDRVTSSTTPFTLENKHKKDASEENIDESSKTSFVPDRANRIAEEFLDDVAPLDLKGTSENEPLSDKCIIENFGQCAVPESSNEINNGVLAKKSECETAQVLEGVSNEELESTETVKVPESVRDGNPQKSEPDGNQLSLADCVNQVEGVEEETTDKLVEETETLSTQEKISEERSHCGDCEARTIEPEYVNIVEKEVSSEAPDYVNSGVEASVNLSVPEYVNLTERGSVQEREESEISDYASCDVENTERTIYENTNEEADPYDEYVNIVNMENTKNSLEYENSAKDDELVNIYAENEEDVNSDNDSSNLFGVLTDIRFSGPSDSQLMSTSFSENNDEQEWDSGSDSRSSSSGEFIWKMENIKPLEGIAEDAYEESDISSRRRKIEQSRREETKRGVVQKAEIPLYIRVSQRTGESSVAESRFMETSAGLQIVYRLGVDGETFLPTSIDDNETFTNCSSQPKRISNNQNLYQLTNISDFISDEGDNAKSQEEFFISGSSQPFHSHSLSSQFFPGNSNWTAENATPDSGVEDVIPASLIENKYSTLSDSVPTLKQLASEAVSRRKHQHFKNKDVLGGLRHTRNKLKLDLPPSPSAFTSDKMFVIEPLPEPVVREKPTFTTFGKSRFLVQHVDTPPDESKSRNVSFEALPYKPLEQDTLQDEIDRFTLMDETPLEKTVTKNDHSDLCQVKIEVVKGEASVLDSGDEDSGIESSTLERKVVRNVQT